jgi:thioredoxin 1
MTNQRTTLTALGISLWLLATACAMAAEAPQAVPPATVESTHPGLASGALVFAKLGDLPAGTLLDAGGVQITEKHLKDEIAKAPQAMQAQLTKNAFFVLERIATEKLLLQAAKQHAAENKLDTAGKLDRDIIQSYFSQVLAGIKVTDAEVKDFYDNNKDMCGGAALDAVKAELGKYVLQQKQMQTADNHIRTLGQRMPITVSAPWAKQQVALAKDNPVDKARASGKPTLVDFGAEGCRPCDMMAPILETLKKKYDGKANVIFVHVRQEEILAARYGIQAIPVQVIFDKDGKEVFRHTGFMPQNEIEKQLEEMGVK